MLILGPFPFSLLCHLVRPYPRSLEAYLRKWNIPEQKDRELQMPKGIGLQQLADRRAIPLHVLQLRVHLV